MTFMVQDQKLMTTDARGRVRVPVERREALLDEFERSGVSGAKFAAMVGVKYPTFALWVQKRRKAGATAKADAGLGNGIYSAGNGGPVRLFEAFSEVGGGPMGGLKMELPGG